MCTVFNMGNYIREKDKLFKKIFDLNNELIQTKPEFQAINNEDFLNLEKFMIAGHAAGVERSMAHHASCTDWHNRLHKEGYDELAKECIRNGLTDLAWLKDNGPFAQDGKDKIKRLEDAFTLIS